VSDTSPRRLFLLRHAQPSWPRPGDPDHDRPLAPRGVRVLPAVAAQIDRYLEQRLDLVLASTAVRVQATLDGVLPRIAAPRDVRTANSLYLADLDQLLRELREIADDVRSVLLCGHNPGLHQLALTLLDDAVVPARLGTELPPAALVVIDLEDEWAEADAGSGRLVAFSVPPQE
jgi:phosphohistidine phosphatase